MSSSGAITLGEIAGRLPMLEVACSRHERRPRAECVVRHGNDEINVSAAAFCAPQPRSPIRQRQLGTVAGDLLGNIRLDLVPTRLAPND
jgi:hypothetical protein